MSRLVGTLADVELLGGFLHDAALDSNAIEFDASQGWFTCVLDRIGYEFARQARSFFFGSKLQYPSVSSRLTITGVAGFTTEGDASPGAAEYDEFHGMSLCDESRLVIETDCRRFALDIVPTSQLILDDIELPSQRIRFTDLGGPSFSGLDLVERLRVDA